MGKYANRRKKKNREAKNALVARSTPLPVHPRFAAGEEALRAEENSATDFSVRIPEKVFEKIMYWINKASPNEVSGFGHLDFDEETRQFRVRDAILLEQVVTAGSAEIDAKALGKAMYEHRNEVNALKWHWHSHPTFEVFWSGTDMNLIRELGQQGWILASVFNCKKESRSAFLTSVEVLGKQHDIFVDEIPLKIVKNYSLKDLQSYDREFDAKVSNQRSYAVYTPPVNIQREEKNEETGNSYPRKLYPSDYDVNGFAILHGDYIYNPMYDKEVLSRKDVYNMIDEMKDEELEELMKSDFNFPTIYRDYVEDRKEKLTSEADHGQEH